MFIMRPDPGLLASRALGRVAATFAGVLVAALVVRRGPTEVALALIVVSALAAMIGTRTSRWYVASGATGLVVLLMAGVTSTGVRGLIPRPARRNGDRSRTRSRFRRRRPERGSTGSGEPRVNRRAR
jgi:uncharacterized membrane protein YccC